MKEGDKKVFDEWQAKRTEHWPVPDGTVKLNPDYLEPPEVTWTGSLTKERILPSTQSLIALAVYFCATRLNPFQIHFLVLFVINGSFVTWLGVSEGRRRKIYLDGLTKLFLDGEQSSTHFLVKMTYFGSSNGDVRTAWTDIGAMLVENDLIAYSSASVSFVISGQDIRTKGGTTHSFPSQQKGDWIVDIPLRRKETDFIRIRTLTSRIDQNPIAKEFIENLASFKNSRPTTTEPRSLPPRQGPKRK